MCCMMGHGMDHGGEMGKPAVEGGQQVSFLDVLRRRCAAGEISRDQLEEMKAVLCFTDGKAVRAGAGNSNPWEAEHHG